jgi:hypothetical protein
MRNRDVQPNGQKPNAKGNRCKYVVVWERVGKQWNLAADIWNDRKQGQIRLPVVANTVAAFGGQSGHGD